MSVLLTDEASHFIASGYVLKRELIPRALIERAVRAINASLGDRGIDPASLTTFRAQSYCPELKTSPAIVDLFNETGAKALAEAAIGAGKLKAVKSGQIALRFPRGDSGSGSELPPPRAHIDGMYSPTNGVQPGTIANFTALLGVLLSDVPHENAGNFTVWPGSHLKHEQYFREHGPQALMNGMPPIDIGPPNQITGRAGDVILTHYLLGHAAAQNVSPHVRYAVFFRLYHVDHEQQRWESMTDAWRQWEGLSLSDLA